MNRNGFKWCWPPTRCKIYAAHAAVLRAIEEGFSPREVIGRAQQICLLGFDEMIELAPLRCVVCLKRGTPNSPDRSPERRLTLDHIVPGSAGTKNLLTLCMSCNSSRGSTPIRRWLRDKHEAGELDDAPRIVLRRVELARRAQLVDAIGMELLRIYYPKIADKIPGRAQRVKDRKKMLATYLDDVPF